MSLLYLLTEKSSGRRPSKMREKWDERPTTVDGTRNNLWVAMDYADTIVHVFVPDCREFYDIDHLWEDAPSMEIEDID